jgi:hypothetical protein
MSATKLIEKMENAELRKPLTWKMKTATRRKVTLPCVELSNGLILTLRERKIMKLIIAEATDRAKVLGYEGGEMTEVKNVYQLLGDYIAAYKLGNINESDFERCG